mmetsp:Transcript_9585/g.35887  ORF Transcript_9585/g.35887 Transcript_9585/m.35887 type:complete len:254 (-) Transcript_9585:393-1154(-)
MHVFPGPNFLAIQLEVAERELDLIILYVNYPSQRCRCGCLLPLICPTPLVSMRFLSVICASRCRPIASEHHVLDALGIVWHNGGHALNAHGIWAIAGSAGSGVVRIAGDAHRLFLGLRPRDRRSRAVAIIRRSRCPRASKLSTGVDGASHLVLKRSIAAAFHTDTRHEVHRVTRTRLFFPIVLSACIHRIGLLVGAFVAGIPFRTTSISEMHVDVGILVLSFYGLALTIISMSRRVGVIGKHRKSGGPVLESE